MAQCTVPSPLMRTRLSVSLRPEKQLTASFRISSLRSTPGWCCMTNRPSSPGSVCSPSTLSARANRHSVAKTLSTARPLANDGRRQSRARWPSGVRRRGPRLAYHGCWVDAALVERQKLRCTWSLLSPGQLRGAVASPGQPALRSPNRDGPVTPADCAVHWWELHGVRQRD